MRKRKEWLATNNGLIRETFNAFYLLCGHRDRRLLCHPETAKFSDLVRLDALSLVLGCHGAGVMLEIAAAEYYPTRAQVYAAQTDIQRDTELMRVWTDDFIRRAPRPAARTKIREKFEDFFALGAPRYN